MFPDASVTVTPRAGLHTPYADIDTVADTAADTAASTGAGRGR